MASSTTTLYIENTPADPSKLVGHLLDHACKIEVVNANSINLSPSKNVRIMPTYCQNPMVVSEKCNTILVGVFFVITNRENDKILLIKKKNGIRWYAPGGIVNSFKGSLEETGIHNVLKETGISLELPKTKDSQPKIIQELPVYAPNSSIVNRHLLLTFYQHSLPRCVDYPDVDDLQLKWIPIGEFLNGTYDALDSLRNVIKALGFSS